MIATRSPAAMPSASSRLAKREDHCASSAKECSTKRPSAVARRSATPPPAWRSTHSWARFRRARSPSNSGHSASHENVSRTSGQRRTSRIEATGPHLTLWVIEERHGSPGTLRALGGLGGHLGAPHLLGHARDPPDERGQIGQLRRLAVHGLEPGCHLL